METIRERNLKAGMPYIRQVVTWKGKTCTVMVYDFCTSPNVQLADGIHETGINWNTTKHKWIPYAECTLSHQDREYIHQFRMAALAAQEGHSPEQLTKHQDDIRRGLRKPMPKPTIVHKRKNRTSRQKAKAALRKGKGNE